MVCEGAIMRVRSLILAAGVLAIAVPMTAMAQSPTPAATVPASPLPLPLPSGSPGPLPSAVVSTVNPVCDPFLTAEEAAAALGDSVVSSDGVDYHDSNPPLQHIECQWHLAGGQTAALEVYDLLFGVTKKPFLIEKYGPDNMGGAPVAGLGTKAYSGTTWPGDYVAWAVADGKIDRTITLNGGSIPVASLAALAKVVRGTATPGVEPVASTAPVSATIVGDWSLVSFNGKPAPIGVTATFGADGVSVFTIDCKPYKGKAKPAFSSTYTVDGDTVDVRPAQSSQSCKASDAQDQMNEMTFALALATQPGTWSIDGTTLTVHGPGSGSSSTLVFEAVAP